jgi:AcrR family transcriptional regulator
MLSALTLTLSAWRVKCHQMANAKFHHGNLRAELLRLAATELEARGYEELSLRNLAARLDVSRAAPYRHFKNKDDLLRTLALGGVQLLRELYHKASEEVVTPIGRLRLACRAYIDFAERSPELFRLIFVSDAYLRMIPDAPGAPPSAYGIFEQLVADVIGVDNFNDRRMAALTCWSTIHGFAMLRMSERINAYARTEDIAEAVLTAACARFQMKDDGLIR